MKTKYFIITVVLAIAVLCFSFVANAQTANIQALIAQIKIQIAQLQAQLQNLLDQQQGGQAWCHTFNTNIGMGQKTGNPEIEALKSALRKEGLFNDTMVSYINEGYNESLALAVTGFQEKYASEILSPYNLKRGTGFVGATTRSKLNMLYGCKNFCTQDAKQCPDGSYVGRTGPNCEFTQCPITNTNIECTTAKNCQDTYKNCYYSCSNNKCVSINTFVALKPYPDCTSTFCPTVNCFVDSCPGKHLPDANGCVNCSTPCSST